MTSKDEKNLARVIAKIAAADEPRRTAMQRVHDAIMAAAPSLKPRIWYGMPAYARSASTPALITLRNDERLNLAITEKVARDEKRRDFMRSAEESLEHFKRTGIAYRHEDAEKYFLDLVAGKNPRKPRPIKVRRCRR